VQNPTIMVQIKEVIQSLEKLAPPVYQESYDNSGLLTGDYNALVQGVLISLDCTEKVVEEAVRKKCNMIVAHHPIIFSGLKKLTGSNYIERTIISAIKNDIAIYAIHTNLDNVIDGVNKILADKIGLIHTSILLPKKNTQKKLVTYIPAENVDDVLSELHKAGAGIIGDYSHCSFKTSGTGSYIPSSKANPHIGTTRKKEIVDEVKVELVFPIDKEQEVIQSLKATHPYEEVAYFINSTDNTNRAIGSGMIGELDEPMDAMTFLQDLKRKLNLKIIRHTAITKKNIKKIAICGGSGNFLLKVAKKANADLFISGDFKYHEFFDAENEIIIADIGHYESEVYTKELINEYLLKNFSNFAVHLGETVTNPISYL